MTAEKGTFAWDGESVSALWHHPPRSGTYVVLGHGAGGNLHTPGLAQFAEALATRDVGAVRFNFPYAEAKRKGPPDRRAVLDACYRAAASAVAARASRLVLGGRSMGGRIASHIVADGVGAAGLLFLGYPLHPPGQPDRLRDAHLGKIAVPMLFLQGSADPFARPDLLAKTVARLPKATLYVIEGANHGLTVRGRPAQEIIDELAEVSVAWLAAL